MAKCQTQFWLIDKSPQHDALQAPVIGPGAGFI
jgi:hypothetical protein